MDPMSVEVGELITEVFLVAEARKGVDRRGQDYYSLTLNCEGGHRTEAKVWADNLGAPLEAGMGIEVLARVDEYMGTRQLNVQRYKVLAPGEFDPAPYVRSTEVDVEEAFNILFDWEREGFENPWLKALMREFRSSEGFAREFKASPAAFVHHHNYMGGLIEHTLEVWRLAERLGEHYSGLLDRELLLCGAALHDVGKVKSYSISGGVSQPTDLGQLLDHIFMSASMVSNLWDRAVTRELAGADAEGAARTKALLLHIVLSHHGRKEWGAPVLPQTPEAIIIHYCDQMSATMKSCTDALAARGEGEQWTQKLFIMDSPRRMYAPPRPGGT